MRKATCDFQVNERFSSLRLIGGNDCFINRLSHQPDLDVLGGARVRKTLCVEGDGLFGGEVAIEGNLVVMGTGTFDEVITNYLTVLNGFEMSCANISNVEVIEVNTIIPKGNVISIDGDLDVMGTGTLDHLVVLNDCELNCGNIANVNSIELVSVLAKQNGNVTIVGNLIVTGDIVGAIMDGMTGNLIADNLDLNCGVISNVETLEVDTIISKSGLGISINDDVTVSGNLTIIGNTTSVETQTIVVEDNKITVNSGETGAGVTAGNAGLEIDRGTEVNYVICYDETKKGTVIGNIGTEQMVATREDVPIDGGIAYWNASAVRFDTDIDMMYDIANNTLNVGNLNTDCILSSKIDLNCGNISNVEALFVHDVFGKSPINVHDTLYIRDTGTGGNVWFESGIVIGDSLTQSGASDSIALGKNAQTLEYTGPLQSSSVTSALITQANLEMASWVSSTPSQNVATANVAWFNGAFNPGADITKVILLSNAVGTFQPGMVFRHIDALPQYSIGIGALQSLNTTISSGSNGVDLGTAPGVINVASTTGFQVPQMALAYTIFVTTSLGVQQVTYTGLTATSFTGVLGGSGIMSTGGSVTSGGLGQIGSVYESFTRLAAITIIPQSTGLKTLTSGDVYPYDIPVYTSGKTVYDYYPINVPANGDEYYFQATIRPYKVHPSDVIQFWIASADGLTDLALIYTHTDIFTGGSFVPIIKVGPTAFKPFQSYNADEDYRSIDFDLGAYSSTTVSLKIVVTNNTGNFLYMSFGGAFNVTQMFSKYYPDTISPPSKSIALGSDVTILGGTKKSIVMGYNNTLGRDYSISVGMNNNADTYKSIAIGHNNTTTQSYAVAIGRELNAGYKSVVIGHYNITNNYSGIAVGYRSYAYQGAGIAIGKAAKVYSSTTYGKGGISMGYYTYNYQSGGIAIGKYSSVFNNGGQSINGIVIGIGAISGDSFGVSLGHYSYAQNISGIALGKQSNSSGDSSIAIGDNASTSHEHSIAIGTSATTGYTDCISIGRNSSTNSGQTDNIAIGKDASTLYSYSIAIGSGAKARGTLDIIIGYNAQKYSAPTFSNGFNVAIGYGTLSYGTTGGGHVAIGDSSLRGHNSWSRDTYNQIAIGQDSANYANSSQTISIGTGALRGLSSISNVGFKTPSTIAIGYRAMQDVSGYAYRNIAIGGKSLYKLTGTNPLEAAFNVALGYNVGYRNPGISVITGSKNTLLGSLSKTTAINTNSGVAVGYNATTSQFGVAIGQNAIANYTDDVAIGNPVPTNATAKATVWGQKFSDRAWVGGGYTGAVIDNSGNLQRGTIGGGWVGLATSNLDMDCFSIQNVNELHVGNVYGKSPINVHDTLYIRDTGTGGNVWFESGVVIGDINTSASTNSIAIGKQSTALGNQSIAIGTNVTTSAPNSLVLGRNSQTTLYADNSIVLGRNAISRNTNNIVIGYGASTPIASPPSNCIIMGTNSVAEGGYSIVIGTNISSKSFNGVAIGYGSKTYKYGSSAMAIGSNARAYATDSIALGRFSYTGQSGVSLRSMAIGFNANVAANIDCVALGSNVNGVADGGFFVKHRALASGSFNNAAFNNATNELVEVTSSIRFKQDVRELESISDVFDKLRAVRYRAKPEYGDTNKEVIGLIAEELVEIFPEFITRDSEGLPAGIAYDHLVSILIREIQSLRERERERDIEIDSLKADIQSIKVILNNTL